MRPINRGPAPRSYAKYQDAIEDLENRLGTYCSYCERRLPTSLAVEHVSPKSVDTDHETDWDNFLLGCVNCNSVKSVKPTNETDFLWPDRDNTFLAFTYLPGGFVRVAESLKPRVKKKARELLELVGLERHKFDRDATPPAKRDKRWQQREETWKQAELALRAYRRIGGSDDARELVVNAAISSGFFSVWMAVFEGHSEVCLELISRHKGTDASSFDSDGRPLVRSNGQT